MATLTSITIENFKGIGDAVTIPIRPITLLFGKNSSGKSTVLQALQYMVEVYQNMVEVYQSSAGVDPDRTKIGYGYTDLGGFRSLVHRHDEKRKIHIRLDFDLSIDESENFFEMALSGGLVAFEDLGLGMAKSVSIEVETGWEQSKEKAYPKSFIIYRLNGIEWSRFTRTETLNWNRAHPFFEQARKKIQGIANHHHRSHLSLYSKDVDKNVHLSIKSIVEREIKRINYLGPFREIPSRHFRPQRTPDESLWAKGIEAWNILGRDPTLLEKTNSYMEDFLKLGYTIKLEESVSLDTVLTNLNDLDRPYKLEERIDRIKKAPRQITLKIHNEENDIDLDLPDVGLGISQVIPILVGVSHTGRSVTPDKIGIFAVEEPELHLHPAAQVALGDVFIDGIQNSNPTFLIETHSEHLLLRLLRRVHETSSTRVDTKYKLPPNDLSVVYVQATPAGAKFTPVSVTDDGDFDEPWPEGFFEERDSELFYHA